VVCGSNAVGDPRLLKANGVSGVIALDSVLPRAELLDSPAGALTWGLLISGGVFRGFL